MVSLKKMFVLLLTPILLLSPLQSRADWTENHLLVGALAVGGTIAAGIGINAMVGWFEETNESIISQARTLCTVADKEYAPFISYLMAQDVLFNTHNRTSWHSISEDQLYYLADIQKTINPHSTCKKFIQRLQDNNYAFENLHKKISKRIEKIESSRTVDYKTSIEQLALIDFKARIADQMPLYKQLYSLLDQHRSYFSLFDVEVELRKTYANELSILAHNNYHQAQLVALLKASIASHYTYKYPFTKFVSVLDDHLECLSDYLRSAQRYPTRYNWCADLKNQLSFIKGLIISDHAYSAEVIAQEKERIEREKIALAQQQLSLQAQQLAAMKEQNKLEKEKHKLEEERLRLELLQRNQYYNTNTSVVPEVSFTIKL